ncbi:MAG: Rrf2 family transcriptional regulator [Phycisphaerales bacterium]|nr:Rrf2 family transcriptional regulator [Phycisphaerales bacterium]
MFSQTVEYALRAMVCLATSEQGPQTADEISQRTRLKGGYLSKVMRDLVVAGLVGSQRGPNGGFTLARPPADISILDIVTAVDPIKRITQCPMGNPNHVRLCSLHQRLDNAIGEIERAFQETSLAEVLVEERGGNSQCRALTMPPGVQAATLRLPQPGRGTGL